MSYCSAAPAHPYHGPYHDIDLFRQIFRFTGGEIVGEFLLSTGYLPGARTPACPVCEAVIAAAPPRVNAPRGNGP